MKKSIKFIPLTLIPYLIFIMVLAFHFSFFKFSFGIFAGSLKGFLGIIVMLFQF